MKPASRWRRPTPFRVALVLAAMSFALAGAWIWERYERAARYRGGTYRIGLDHNPPNYEWSGPEGARGFAVDVLNEAASRAGVRLQWVPIEGSSLRAMVMGVIDLWPEAYYRPGQYPEIHQTRPWTEDQHAFVWDRARYPAEPAKWDGLRLALIDRLATRNLATRRFPRMAIEFAPTRRDVVAAMCAGGADVAFVDMRSVEEALLTRPDSCVGRALQVKPLPEMTDPMSVFARKEMGPLAELLRDHIDDMLADGTVLRYADKWFSFSSADVRGVLRLQERTRQVRWLIGLCGLMAVVIGLLAWLVQKLRVARMVAERARQLQAEFLANVSHEVRTPMNGVLGATELLLEMVQDEASRGHVETIRESARTQLELLNQILDQSKIDSGLLLLEMVQFSPRRLLEQVDRAFQPAARRKGLRLSLAVEETVPAVVQGDELRIRQVLTNLVNNAIKFTVAGGVTVAASARQERGAAELTFTVRDTGIGIPPEMRATIFERFRQVDASTTRQYGGTGLGLSISRQMARLMGGELSVDSSVGHGSTFRFRVTLPLARGERAAEAPSGGAGASLVGMRVLLVEDHAVNQRVAQAMLERLGAVVELAVNGREAVERCRAGAFDVVLMDCHMPEMDGFAAAAAIRALELPGARQVPIVALTAGVSGEERARALASGMDAFLSKPVSREELAAAIHGVVRGMPERAV